MKAPTGLIGKIIGSFRKATSEEKERTDQELPFVVMVFTLMAASGVSPYDSWKKLRKLSFLPNFRKEAEEVVRQVEVLGKDPLTVMLKALSEFLGGIHIVSKKRQQNC